MTATASKKAYFAAGCFWGVESFFQAVPGVSTVVSGYAGGHTKSPTYEEVCTGRTGHAETVEVTYDPARVDYEALLGAFFEHHDPTTKDRQGPDRGTQYRSAIFYQDEAERETATRVRESLAGRFSAPIVTEIVPLEAFYPAEDYHQDYYEKRGIAPSCHL
jgi:methionine-S-sulfoxide reductase